MVWYFIYPHYKDEYKTHLNVNVPNKYKFIHIKHKIIKYKVTAYQSFLRSCDSVY